MKNYEINYLVPAETTEEESNALREKIISFIQQEGGLTGDLNLSAPKRPVSLPKSGGAFLLSFTFQLNPEKLNNLEKGLKANDKIIKYLLVNKERVYPRTESEFPEGPQLRPQPRPKIEIGEIDKKLQEILGE